MNDNELEILPAMIGNLVNLESLDVSKNVIAEIPNNIRHCRSLSVIEASVTKIEK